MINIKRDILPGEEYSFQTSVSGRSLPVSVKDFLASKYATEELISVDNGIGPGSTSVWSLYGGWNKVSYGQLVRRFVKLIDRSERVSVEFIESALNDGLSVADAVEVYFRGTAISVSLAHHLSGNSSLLDVDIEGIGTSRRAVLSMNIKKGEMFNIYYDESSKGGATWSSDLVTSLGNYFKKLEMSA